MQNTPAFELRFDSLRHQGRTYAFPCDEQGCVNLDTLSEQARNNYLFAHAMVGRDYQAPCISAGHGQ